MKIVIALGGNALLQRGQAMDANTQINNAKQAAIAIAKLATQHQIILCHGNGPQIGLLALQTLHDTTTPPYPLDILGAQSQGMIGYLLQQQLKNQLPNTPIVTVLTQTVVHKEDTAFQNPTKPIGPTYNQHEVKQLQKQYNWQIAPDGNAYRRVVPSPKPIKVLEQDVIARLSDQKHLVICAGGGGIPVIETTPGQYQGVEAVIDKDHVSSLLAQKLKADHFMILSDIHGVEENHGTPNAKVISKLNATTVKINDYPAGSMRPKIEAACNFTLKTGRPASIGHLSEAVEILNQQTGTLFL